MVLIFHLISQVGANRVGTASSRGIVFQIYWCVDGQTFALIHSSLKTPSPLTHCFAVFNLPPNFHHGLIAHRPIGSSFDEETAGRPRSVERSKVWPSSCFTLSWLHERCQGLILELYSVSFFPISRREWWDVATPNPIPYTAAEEWSAPQQSCSAKFMHSSVLGCVDAGAHQMFCSQWFSDNLGSSTQVQFENEPHCKCCFQLKAAS